jgi:hypothetical protein
MGKKESNEDSFDVKEPAPNSQLEGQTHMVEDQNEYLWRKRIEQKI